MADLKNLNAPSNGPEKQNERGNDVQIQLNALKIQIEGEKDAEKRKELQRRLVRLERFDKVKNESSNPQKEDISKILKEKNADSIKGSDLLTLRKKGVDIASLTLVNETSPLDEVSSKSIQVGEKFIVNFGENKALRDRIGAGDILPPEIRTIKVNGVLCERKNTPRPGYYNEKGVYQPIYDGYKIEIISIGSANKEDAEANERQWKNERLEDMMENNDEPLTDLPEDVALKESIKEYKERAQILSQRFLKGVDVVRATSFRSTDADFANIAKQIGLPEDKIEDIKIIMSAIGEHESNSNYGAKGQVLPSGTHKGTAAIGRYQIMPKNWIPWGNTLFGESVEPTAENQDKIAFMQISKYYMKYSSEHSNKEDIFREIAGDWYGRGSAQIAGHPDTGGYQGSVLAIYRKLNEMNNFA